MLIPSITTTSRASRHFTLFLNKSLPLSPFPPKSLSFRQIHHSPQLTCGHPRKLSPCRSLNPGFPDPGKDDDEDELSRLLSLLPDELCRRLMEHHELDGLIEVVMDLGRTPLARFPSGDFELSHSPITFQDIQFATAQVGDFAIDNRAGISRTLHRISAIRNRKGEIIGLTCRVGRAITGSADLLRDLVKDGASLLLIGPPGVGKTTIIREIARMLADEYKKRVIIVDTSNEIGGDGDIPHAGIGTARRMQVPHLDMQHEVLIEAVENHMPQVIVIDEIGTKLEAMAASTISQRGIQLVATAHGRTIENLIKNPALDMLIGGIQSVTLGDEEASRRRVQKTVLERKGPPTFRCAVELISKTELRVHTSLEGTVDSILAGKCPYFEVRKMDFRGPKGSEEPEPSLSNPSDQPAHSAPEILLSAITEKAEDKQSLFKPSTGDENNPVDSRCVRVFVYGILEETVVQGIRKLSLDDVVELTDNISEADVLVALQSKLKKNPGLQAAAKTHDKPVYVTKTSSLVQVTKALRSLMTDHEDSPKVFETEDILNHSDRLDALEEARIAIERIVIPKGESVELLPRPPHILRLQAELAKTYQLQSEIVGQKPEASLRILPVYSNTYGKQKEKKSVDPGDLADNLDEFIHTNGKANDSSHCSDRLPILPDFPSS